MCIAIYFTCIKLPYEQMVYAAGAFRDTRNGAFAEAAINIIISVMLVNLIGLKGIVIGTIIAIAYRTLRYHVYVCKHIIPRNIYGILRLFLFTILSVMICFIITSFFPITQINNYVSWVLWAVIITVISFLACMIVGLVLLKKDMISVIKLLVKIIKRKRA